MHSSPWGKKQNWHNFDQQCVYDPAEVCVTEVVQVEIKHKNIVQSNEPFNIFAATELHALTSFRWL